MMLDALTINAIEQSTGSTFHGVDRKRNALAIRAWAHDPVARAEVMRIIATKNMQWLAWQSVVQRQWQVRPKNSSAREQYVRCM